MAMAAAMDGGVQIMDAASNQMEKPHHYSYLKDFRTKQCPEFLLHKCTQHRPFTCFNWHFSNQKRRRPVKRRDGTFNYSSDNYCSKYDETTGICPDGDECPCLHRTAGDTERRYHLRYYKTCPCVYETDSKGHCCKNGLHCAFAHGPQDLRKPVYDIREVQAAENGEVQGIAESPLTNSLESDRLLNENPVWNDPLYVLIHYKTEFCNRPLRLCRQGYACPSYHNPRDKRRSPAQFKYRSTPCPNVKQGDEWGDPSKCDSGDNCSYCHTRTEQQFHLEIYKSTKCNDMVQTGYCPRGLFCAFAHVEQEMNIKWDLSLANHRSQLASFVKNALPSITGSNKDDVETEGGVNLPQACNSTQLDGGEKTNIISTPRKHSLIEFGDLTRRDEILGDSFSGDLKTVASSNTGWVMEPVGKGRIGSSLSSSLNDSFLSNFQPTLKSTGIDTEVGIAPGPFRQSTMSVGSYQQYQQQQNRANKPFHFSGYSSASPVASRYFPSSGPGPASSANPLPSVLFAVTQQQQMQQQQQLQQQQHLQQQMLQAGVPPGLPSAFFRGGGGGETVESVIGRSDDDLDLNLSDLNSALDQEFEKESDLNLINRSYEDRLSSAVPFHCAATMPVMVPVETKDGIKQQQLQSPPISSPLGTFAGTMFGPQQSQPQQQQLPPEQLRQEACEAWKKEAEKQERLLKQVEEERDYAVKIRDNALSKVAEMKHEIEMLSGGSPVLHCLQQDVDFQQMPLSTLQQIRATLQHDYNVLGQKLAEMNMCCICKERPSNVMLHPCNHCVLCVVCSGRTTECPACGMYIVQRSPLPICFA